MAFIKPEEIIDDLPLKKDMAAADFGCGSGGWVVPLAKKLEDGIVFAVDLLEEPLSALRGKVERDSLSNVKIIQENIEERTEIRSDSVDLVLMTNFLFQVDDKEKVFSEARRILYQEGLLLIIEWRPDSSIAPAVAKINPEEVKELSDEAGFELEEEFQAGMHHYGFIYKKKKNE